MKRKKFKVQRSKEILEKQMAARKRAYSKPVKEPDPIITVADHNKEVNLEINVNDHLLLQEAVLLLQMVAAVGAVYFFSANQTILIFAMILGFTLTRFYLKKIMHKQFYHFKKHENYKKK